MAEPIDLIYVGDKPEKRDTVTLSDMIFPRLVPVPTPADLAHKLLRYPSVWRKAADLEKVTAELEQDAKFKAEEAARLEAEAAARAAAEDMTVDGFGDLNKLTSAKLKTLVEGEGLDVEQGPQERVDDFRVRVRNALKAKIATAGNDE